MGDVYENIQGAWIKRPQFTRSELKTIRVIALAAKDEGIPLPDLDKIINKTKGYA